MPGGLQNIRFSRNPWALLIFCLPLRAPQILNPQSPFPFRLWACKELLSIAQIEGQEGEEEKGEGKRVELVLAIAQHVVPHINDKSAKVQREALK